MEARIIIIKKVTVLDTLLNVEVVAGQASFSLSVPNHHSTVEIYNFTVYLGAFIFLFSLYNCLKLSKSHPPSKN